MAVGSAGEGHGECCQLSSARLESKAKPIPTYLSIADGQMLFAYNIDKSEDRIVYKYKYKYHIYLGITLITRAGNCMNIFLAFV